MSALILSANERARWPGCCFQF